MANLFASRAIEANTIQHEVHFDTGSVQEINTNFNYTELSQQRHLPEP